MKKTLIICALCFVALSTFFAYQLITYSDQKLHIIFCSVGQGDAVIIRSPSQKTLIFDAGPDSSVLNCLSNHLPFWDKTIDYALLSHPHLDHFMGFLDVFSYYQVKAIAGEDLINPSLEYREFLKRLQSQNLSLHTLARGDRIKISDGVVVHVLGPTKEYLQHTSPHKMIGESQNFGSLHVRVSYKDFSLDLTGDNQAEQLADDINVYGGDISILQTPHHGSKYGLTKEILQELHPQFAAISVGKNNYGHPSAFTLDLYKSQNVLYKRTDQSGTIEVITDGKRIEIHQER